MAIIYTDPNTGVYENDQNQWCLADGTPIQDYDPKTGAYQENDGTWYTFQGVALKNYDMSLGAYQENDGVWYDTNGNEVPMGSNLYNQIKAYGYDASQNTTPVGTQGKVSKNTVNTTNAAVKTAVKPNNWMLPVVGIISVVAVVTIIYFATKKK